MRVDGQSHAVGGLPGSGRDWKTRPAGHLGPAGLPKQENSMANRHHRTRPRKRSQQTRSPSRWLERIGLLGWVLLAVVRRIFDDLGN
jgi:hypothetical protein